MSTQQKYIDIKEQRGQYWLENIMKDKFAVSMFGQKRLSREGGIEIVVKELCTRMARDGCQVTCYNRSGHHVSGAEYDNKIEYDGIRQKFVYGCDCFAFGNLPDSNLSDECKCT